MISACVSVKSQVMLSSASVPVFPRRSGGKTPGDLGQTLHSGGDSDSGLVLKNKQRIVRKFISLTNHTKYLKSNFSQKNTMMEIPLPMPRIINAGKKFNEITNLQKYEC